MVPFQRRFSQDFERILLQDFFLINFAQRFSLRGEATCFEVEKQLAIFSDKTPPVDFPRNLSAVSPSGGSVLRPWSLLKSLICLRTPTRRSSTLWFRIADTSMYLQSRDSAAFLPSAVERIKNRNGMLGLIFKMFQIISKTESLVPSNDKVVGRN